MCSSLPAPVVFKSLFGFLFMGWQDLLFHSVDKIKSPAQMHLLLKILPGKINHPSNIA